MCRDEGTHCQTQPAGTAPCAIASLAFRPPRGSGVRHVLLIVHELATDAKYGALSNDGGHVLIDWETRGRTVTMRWQEQGGPAVLSPESKGFGSTLLAECVTCARRPNGSEISSRTGQGTKSAAPAGRQACGAHSTCSCGHSHREAHWCVISLVCVCGVAGKNSSRPSQRSLM